MTDDIVTLHHVRVGKLFRIKEVESRGSRFRLIEECDRRRSRLSALFYRHDVHVLHLEVLLDIGDQERQHLQL